MFTYSFYLYSTVDIIFILNVMSVFVLHMSMKFVSIILDAWCSSDNNRGYVYFQIELPQLALLSRIAVQGGKDILKKMNDYWVKK